MLWPERPFKGQMSPGGMEVQDDSDDELHTVMGSVRGGEKSAPMLCDLEVQQEPVEFETDTGSPFTIMGSLCVTSQPPVVKDDLWVLCT